MTFTQVFGGSTIYPSDVSHLELALTTDVDLSWPLEISTTETPAARIIDVTSTGAYMIDLPEATLTGPGQTILFNNLPASSHSFVVRDFAGNLLATVAVGEVWQVYLAGAATSAGVWRVFCYGASTATVQPSALAGYGITVTSNLLSQSIPVTTFSSSPRTVLATDRASILVWNGTGAGTLDLPASTTVGNNYFFSARNSGGGDLTLDPSAAETIDGGSTLVLRPGDSASLFTDGLAWYSLGLGRDAVFAFDFTTISLAGAGVTYTLSGAELNRIAYKLTGALSNNVNIVVPPTIQQYWVDNSTTGAHTVTLSTSGGTPVTVSQGARGIYYCNGSNIINADTAGISLPVSATDGGTGITSYTKGDMLVADSGVSITKLTAVATGNVLLSGGVGLLPAWGKVDLTVHVTGALPVANGGTGLSTLTSGYILTGNGTGSVTLLAPPAGSLVGTSATQTLTNKRVTARVSSTASITSPLAWNSDNYDQYEATAQSTSFTVSADAGTPTDAQDVIFRVLDNGTSRRITFTGGSSNSFRVFCPGFTTSGSDKYIDTTANKTIYIGARYNAAAARWDILSVAEET